MSWASRARATWPPIAYGIGFLLLWEVAARVFDTMLSWQERAVQRHALRGLDARSLADIGLTRADVELEASKPFWQP